VSTNAAVRGASDLRRYAWLSIGAAVVTIALKSVAYLVTGSVGLLSDAAESAVNLVAAIIALIALTVAARPADAGHHYGHGKAEYFSAGLEGLMIFVAAAVILFSAVGRFIHPVALDSVGLGAAISAVATVVNAVVGLLLIRVGRRDRSVTLIADGKHLMTDVWTSVGVIAGVVLVGVTGWQRLDPVVAAVVGVNILVTGGRLVAQSVRALLDQSLGPVESAAVVAALDGFRSAEVSFHGLQTSQSGRYRFVSVHVLVPGAWTVQAGHDLLERIEATVRDVLPDTTVLTHLEPSEDPRAYDDYAFDGYPDPPTRPDDPLGTR
jgi:cation diffusion facilitator family transporter